MGVSSLFKVIPIDRESMKVILPLTLISSVVVFIFGNINMEISREEGIMLLGLFIIFMMYVIVERFCKRRKK